MLTATATYEAVCNCCPKENQTEGVSHRWFSLALFSQGGSVVSCFLLAGAKSTDRVWLLISNYEMKRKKNTRLGFPQI